MHAAVRCPAEASHPSLLLLHITGEENPHVCSARPYSQALLGPASSLVLCSCSFSFPFLSMLLLLHQTKSQMLHCSENASSPPKQQDGTVSSCQLSPQSAHGTNSSIRDYLLRAWLVRVRSDWRSLTLMFPALHFVWRRTSRACGGGVW